MVTIYYSSAFKKSVRRYSSYKKQITRRIELFIQNPHDKRLKTHKLTGKLVGFWSFSVTHSLRIMFEFINDSEVGFIDIGTHEIYK